MRKFLKEAWAVLVERCKTHKALRILNKQVWSTEYLTALLVRAANIANKPLEMVIQGPGGAQLMVRTTEQRSTTLKDDSVFDHLDDDAYIRQFMESIR